MKTLIVALAILGAAPAFAQNSFTTTQSPPAGNSSQSTPNTTNGLPQTAGTEKPTQQPGSAVGETATQTLGSAVSKGAAAVAPSAKQ